MKYNNSHESKQIWNKNVEITGLLDSKILSVPLENRIVVSSLIADSEAMNPVGIYRCNVQALRMDSGDEMWDLNFTEPTSALLASEPVVNLMNADGGILVRFSSNLYYINYDGEIIWVHGNCTQMSKETIIDLWDDGTQEIVVGTIKGQSEELHIIRVSDGEVIYSLSGHFIGFSPADEVILYNTTDDPSLAYVSIKGDLISINIEKNIINWMFPQGMSSTLLKYIPMNDSDTRDEITLWRYTNPPSCTIFNVYTGQIIRCVNISNENILIPFGELITNEERHSEYFFLQSTTEDEKYNILAIDGINLDTLWSINNVTVKSVGPLEDDTLTLISEDRIMYINIQNGYYITIQMDTTVIDAIVVHETSEENILFYISEREIGAYRFLMNIIN